MAEQQKNIEVCPGVRVVNEEKKRKIQAAIEGGDLKGMAELQSALLAGMHDLASSELDKLIQDGFSIESPIFNKDGDVTGYIQRVNPGAEPTLKILEQIGATGAQQSITPKSRGEKVVGESIDELARMLAGRAASRVIDDALPKKAIEAPLD